MSSPARTPNGAPPWRGYVALSLAWSALLAVILFVNRRPSTEPIVIVPPPTASAIATVAAVDAPSPTPELLIVDVAGAVRSPGVYRLSPGSVVADAIAAAGGAAADADLDRLNKAIVLESQMQVYVPHRTAADAPGEPEEAGATRAGPIVPVAPSRANTTPQAESAAAPDTGPVNINTASLEQLDTLPGVGPATAQKIVEGRPYGTIEDLLRVDGIGDAKLAKLKDLITVR
jgi:competence protein ComEA